jgi:hypothetical protein
VAKPSSTDGQRDLSLIRASGSTARVLNLALVFERFGESTEFLSRPLFRCQRLNRSLILKHALRPNERALFENPEPHTTKIVFPYSPTELSIGGTSVMLGEKRFDQLIRKAVGEDVSDSDYSSDFELLCVLHEAPSFDPFLLREQLARLGREPARCFFEISDADIASMLSFVASEFEPLTTMAFGANGRRAQKLSMRLAEKLMTDENAQLLEPLRQTLSLSTVEYREGVFAWKGFLYYKWALGEMARRHRIFAPSFSGCTIVTAERAERMEIERSRTRVLALVEHVLNHASTAMRDYGAAFSAFSKGQSPGFRKFLLEAPARFIPLGEAIGAVKHIHSLWGFRFPEHSATRLDAPEARQFLQEFERMLTGVELISDALEADVLII